MHNLLRIKPVTRDRDVKGLRILYDSIETQARSLQSLGIDSKNYGALLAPVIMEKVPHFIRLIINRTVKEWDLELMLNVLREELQARENCGNGEKEREHSTIKQEEEQQQQHRKNFINYSIRENSLLIILLGKIHSLILRLSLTDSQIKKPSILYTRTR